jgi:hypothetical protein
MPDDERIVRAEQTKKSPLGSGLKSISKEET